MGLESWKAKSCLELNSVICYKENDKAEPSVRQTVQSSAIPKSSALPSPNPSDAESRRLGAVPIVNISVAVIVTTLFILAIIIAVYLILRWRKANGSRKKLVTPQPPSDAMPLLTKGQKRDVSVALIFATCDMNCSPDSDDDLKITMLTLDNSNDTYWYRGMKFVNLYVHALELASANKKSFDISFDILDNGNGASKWDQYTKKLERIRDKNYDIVFLSAGLGNPPNSNAHQTLCDIRTSSITITNSNSAKTSSTSSECPGENVIVTRNSYQESEGKGVDFDVTKNNELDSICKGPWTGALRITALAARILAWLSENSEEQPNNVINTAQTTKGMRNILKNVCARGYSKDNIPIIKPEMQLTEELMGKVRDSLKLC